LKKILLALATTLLLPNMSYAAACVDGPNPDGCKIETTGIDYTLTGDISTTGDNAYGLYLLNSTNNTTTLTGDISTTGEFAHGLYLSGSNYNTTLTGGISTTGLGAYGLRLSDSNYNTTTLTKGISTTKNYAHGLYLFNSHNNTTTLTGDISTAGDNGRGLVFSDSNYNTTTLTGGISTTGLGAYGLYLSDSNYNTTTLTKGISTTKNNAFGLVLSNSNYNTTTLTGDISTGSVDGATGDNAYGLYLLNSTNNTTTLTGDISTAGDTAHGLALNVSDSNIIHLTGTLSATGTGSNAISANSTSDNNTITFNQGSKIIGGLDNDGANNTLKFNLGRAASYNFTTSGAVNWVLDDTTKTVIAGSAKSRGVADMDDSSNRLYQRLSQINSSLTTQHREVAQGKVRGDYWIDTYNSDIDRDTVVQEVNQNTRGITVGFNATDDRELAMDVIVNYETSDVKYGLSEQTIDSNSLMVGVAFPGLIKAMDGSLAVKLLTGVSNNDRDLKVLNNTLATGQETVTDKYDSVYATAGAEWMQSLYATRRFKSQFLVGMDINHERIEGSTASAYYRLNDRDITQLVGHAQYGVTITGINEKLRINGNIGVSHVNLVGGEKQSYSIDGTPVSYRADKSNTYRTASLGANYQVTPQAYVYANLKGFISNDDIEGATGNMGVVVNF
jgi:hypothetical protein